MKLKMYKLFDEKKLVGLVELVGNELKSCKKVEISYTHNHILEYFDIIKVNSKVKNTVGTEFHLMSRVITTHDWTKWASILMMIVNSRLMRLLLKHIHLMRYIL